MAIAQSRPPPSASAIETHDPPDGRTANNDPAPWATTATAIERPVAFVKVEPVPRSGKAFCHD